MRQKTLILILVGTLIVVANPGYSRPKSKTNSNVNTSKIESNIKSILRKYGKFSDNYFVNIKLAWLFLSIRKTANSKFYYKRALKINNNSIEAKLGLYCANVADGKYDVARRYLNDVIRKDPLNYYANLYLTYSNMGRENYTSAIRVIQKMLRVYPSDQAFLKLLQSSYIAQKNTRLARKVQQRLNLLQK